MKQSILIIFLLYSLKLFSQNEHEYNFNLATEYKPENIIPSKVFIHSFILTDSIDNSYYMGVYKNFKELYAVLYDKKLKLNHYFRINTGNDKTFKIENIYNINYAFSIKNPNWLEKNCNGYNFELFDKSDYLTINKIKGKKKKLLNLSRLIN